MQADVLLNVIGVFDAGAQAVAQEGQAQACQHAQHTRQRQDHGFLGFDGALWYSSTVDDAHVANFAFFDEAQLLKTVEQAGVELVVDLDIACEAQEVLFYIGEGFGFAFHGVDLAIDLLDLGIKHLHAGVLGRKAGL